MSSPTPRLYSRLLPWLAAALLTVSLPALAGKIYQWKDAKGNTHYSDAPPANQGHKSRTLDPKGSTVAPATAKPAAVNADCSNARSNLTILQGKTEVGIDENKDGKPDRNLTAQERANRTQLAEAGVKTYCDVALANET
ncbi:MAG: DUF4124 domain-containing protein [Lysobacter sp.]